MTGIASLAGIVTANRAGKRVGLPAWCTAHPETLRVIFSRYAGSEDSILIEVTSHQVNQFGGYTGMTPSGFANFVEITAQGEGVDPARIILGGNCLGPKPWKSEAADVAMARARSMVTAFVNAGFDKLHLDASTPCADDDGLDEVAMTERVAELCVSAEIAAAGRPVSYVIGAQVSAPRLGRKTSTLPDLSVTTPQALEKTWDLYSAAFDERGLSEAFQRVSGVMVQTGIAFTNTGIFDYDRAATHALSGAIAAIPGAIFEVRPTDYQSQEALSELVADHFAILKVGPELTFAFRQAVVSMAMLEPWLEPDAPSDLLQLLNQQMDADPRFWRDYLAPGPGQNTARLFGLSDRVRYYWPKPEIVAALARLFANIDKATPALGLMAQFLPGIDPRPDAAHSLSSRIIEAQVGPVVDRYREAAGI